VYSNAGRFEEPEGLKTKRINASHPQLIAAGEMKVVKEIIEVGAFDRATQTYDIDSTSVPVATCSLS
jgi:hypothetical protein